MKGFKLCSVVAGSAALMLTSCLGGDNIIKNRTFGVVEKAPITQEIVLRTAGDLDMYSPNLETMPGMELGKCCIFDYEMNLNKQSQLGSKGYYVATIGGIEDVSNFPVVPLTNNEMLEPSGLEQQVAEIIPIVPTISSNMFVQVKTLEVESQNTSYTLYYNVQDSVEVESTTDGPIDVYKLYVVAQADKTGEATVSKLNYVAFNIAQFVHNAGAYQSGKGKEYIYFRIMYRKKASSESNAKYIWTESNIAGLQIPKES